MLVTKEGVVHLLKEREQMFSGVKFRFSTGKAFENQLYLVAVRRPGTLLCQTGMCLSNRYFQVALFTCKSCDC